MPEVLQDLTIWGGSGWMLQTLHSTCGLEYWSCFAAMSVLIRLALSPFVLQGAHTASRFAKIVPEVQFLVSLFTNDMKTLRANKRPVLEKAMLLKTNLHSLSVLYKLYKIHPLSIFKSPLLQTVCLSYISIDLRKIINGRDPLLAQELVDAGGISTTAAAATSTAADAMIASTWSSWIPATPFPWLLPGDLTESDPWFGLPVLAGIMMYANIEVSVGRKSLAGPATAKADTGVLIKDIFQSAAILMPCFTCQLPSGIQIYLVTSFVYTMAQSVVLRNEAFRARVGLPAMATSSTTTLQDGPVDPSSQQGEATSVVRGKYAMLFIRLKQLQQKAREIRGKDGPLLGKYVLADNWDISFPGEYRKSSIEVNTTSSQPPLEPIAVHVFHAMATSRGMTLQQILEQHQTGGAFVHGVTAPLWQLEEQQKEWLAQQPSQRDTATTSTTTSGTKKDKVVDSDADNREVIPDVSDEIMEKANRGLLPVAIKPQSKSTTNVKGPIDLHAKRLQSRGNKKSRSVAGKKRR
jgi:YidC/Oxa1 family membrane protein insertase